MEISEFSIADVATGLRRNKGKVALCFVLIMGSTVALNVVLPRKYVSDAQLLVRLGRENATLDSTTNVRGASSVNMSQKREFETNSVATMLRSRALIERVVDDLGPDAILHQGETESEAANGGSGGALSRVMARVAETKERLRSLIPSGVGDAVIEPRDEAIRELSEELRVETVPETNIIQVSYESRDPEVARRIVSNVIEHYLEEHVRIHRSSGAHKFLMDHLTRLSDELAGSESELVELRDRTGLVAHQEQRTLLVDRLGALKTSFNTLDASLAESQAELNELTKSLERLDTEGVDAAGPMLVGATSDDADGMRSLLYQLQLEAEGSLTKYTEDNVKARRLRSQIETAKAILARQEATIEIQQRKPALVALQAKADKTREQIAEVEEELSRLNANEMQVAQLERLVEIRDVTYREVAKDAERSRIEASLEEAKITNISVVQPATRDLFPVFPNTRANLAVALFASMFISTGIAVLFNPSRRPRPSRRIAVNGSRVLRNEDLQATPSIATSKSSEESMALSKPR